MGKDWDSAKGGRDGWIAWMTEVMRECLRVMKPGAHGLVWAIPRTSHWTATALENAGFEVRDVITHLFGSGFPKSLDISKAIDKAAGAQREITGYAEPLGREGRKAPQGKGLPITQSDGYSNLQAVTDPATPEAKQWQGWGTAAKPAVEMWLLVAKPFTTVPLDDIISHVNQNLRGYVCQQLHAKYAKQISTSNLKDLGAEQSDFAQWIAAVLSTLKSGASFAKMDMFKSPETAEIFLSIALSWKAILVALLNLKSKYTIKMETDLITELKILNCSILPITQDTTTKDETCQNGLKSNAIVVLKSLESALLRLSALMEISAPESVLEKAESLQRPHQEYQRYEPAIAGDVLSEHWLLIRKPLSEKTVAANVEKWGCGGINIDGCRISTTDKFGGGSKMSSSGQTLGVHGSYDRDGFKDGSVLGRFPANLILDEVAAEMLDEQSGDRSSGGAIKAPKTSKGMFKNADQINWQGYSDSGGASRFFYCAKASKSERNAGLEGMPEKTVSHMITGSGKPSVSVKERSAEGQPNRFTANHQNHHPTVKPQKLMEYLIKLITPPNGTILDPFMGSGSTGVAAKKLGFKFVGIEKELEYFEIATRRIDAAI